MYITGGCGALFDGASPDGSKDQKSITRVHQAYGRNYELPNLTAHNETCANIGNALWNWRMFLATGEARFMDVVELALYNSVLSGVSLDGTNFFYVNPLRSVRPMPVELRWKHERVPFMNSFCCPPNLARTLAEVGSYAYAESDDALWVNLYGGNVLTTDLTAAGKVKLIQQTEYPWNGRIRFRFAECPQKEFALKLRVPGWAGEETSNFKPQTPGNDLDSKPAKAGTPNEKRTKTRRLWTLRINDAMTEIVPESSGYLTLRRIWKAGDTVDLDFDMPARIMEANPFVEETLNQVAVKRGPLVYCLEAARSGQANGKSDEIMHVSIPLEADLVARFDRAVLGGVVVIEASGFLRRDSTWNGKLYRRVEPVTGTITKLQFIPYYAWANRGAREMTVWLPLSPR
jgi:DUF1680 family protein